MNEKEISKLVNEVYRLLDRDAISKALENTRPAAKVDALQHLIVEALKKSSIGYYAGELHYFSGRIYERISHAQFYDLLYRLLKKCGLPDGCYARVGNVTITCESALKTKTFSIDRSILVMENCVLDVKTRTMHKFNKKYVQVTAMNFEYNEHEYPILWQKFLDQVLPNKTLQMVLQEFLGSIFIGRNEAKMEDMLILKGPGANGKSVVFETVVDMFGRDNVSTYSPMDLVCGSKTEQEQRLYAVNGKRINYCPDMSATAISKDSAGKLKQLMSGERTEGHKMYCGKIPIDDVPRIMANANRMPYIDDPSEGMRRKIKVIPFEVTIPKDMQDPQLAIKLRAEYPGILNWMLAGRERFIANGYKLTTSKIIDEIAEECQAESSTVLSFMLHKNYKATQPVNDENDLYEAQFLKAQALYFQYTKWCVEMKLEFESINSFGKTLKSSGYYRKQSMNGREWRVYTRKREPLKDVTGKAKKDPVRASGVRELSHWVGISANTIQKMLNKGVLQGTYTKEGIRYKFDIEKAKKVIKKYLRNERLRREKIKVPQALKDERRKFNARMKLKGEPFRKLDSKTYGPCEIIYVTDNFNYDLHKDNYESFIKFR